MMTDIFRPAGRKHALISVLSFINQVANSAIITNKYLLLLY